MIQFEPPAPPTRRQRIMMFLRIIRATVIAILFGAAVLDALVVPVVARIIAGDHFRIVDAIQLSTGLVLFAIAVAFGAYPWTPNTAPSHPQPMMLMPMGVVSGGGGGEDRSSEMTPPHGGGGYV